MKALRLVLVLMVFTGGAVLLAILQADAQDFIQDTHSIKREIKSLNTHTAVIVDEDDDS